MSTTRPGDTSTGEAPPSFIEEARRQQLIQATITVVAQVGYAQASVARIAQQAGISKGLISYHFRNKEDLFAQTLKETFRSISAAVTQTLDLTQPAPIIMRQLLAETANYGATHHAQFRALDEISRNLRNPSGQQLLTLADYEEVYQGLERLFQRGQREGHFRSFDTRVMAVTYQSAVDTMFAYADAHPDTDLKAYADSLADILFQGILIHASGD
ncbi:TetR family transcriptional regulator [Deinococcus rubellus]|uniref:TetR/AcrR family transcriptional regulator n=1 Tax=Deinococcus rubellus TaxID=1889240 RepID=UPI0031EEF32F